MAVTKVKEENMTSSQMLYSHLYESCNILRGSIEQEISSSTLATMNKNLPVATAVLDKICNALDCHPSDIVSAKALRSLKNRKSAKNYIAPERMGEWQ